MVRKKSLKVRRHVDTVCSDQPVPGVSPPFGILPVYPNLSSLRNETAATPAIFFAPMDPTPMETTTELANTDDMNSTKTKSSANMEMVGKVFRDVTPVIYNVSSYLASLASISSASQASTSSALQASTSSASQASTPVASQDSTSLAYLASISLASQASTSSVSHASTSSASHASTSSTSHASTSSASHALISSATQTDIPVIQFSRTTAIPIATEDIITPDNSALNVREKLYLIRWLKLGADRTPIFVGKAVQVNVDLFYTLQLEFAKRRRVTDVARILDLTRANEELKRKIESLTADVAEALSILNRKK